MKVCWLSNYYSPYKLKLYDELSKYVDLTAIMLGGSEGENRNDEWVLKEHHSFNVELINKNYCNKIKKLAKENDVLIDSMYSTIYGCVAVSAFKKENKITIMQADGGIAIDRGIIINKILSILMNRHDYFYSTGAGCDKYYGFYKVNIDLIKHYRFSSLTSKNIVEHRKDRKDKDLFRKELNIDDKFTIISVGQPIERKGFDILLDAYIKTGLTNDINVYIIGGKPQENVRRIVDERNLTNVHFVGLLSSEELSKYYSSADAFVLCTREDIWGLVIEEAMSYGLPVITSDNCVAGVHFRDINESTIICGVNDIDEYSKSIINLFEDSILVNELSTKSLDIIKDYTIENSALDIIDNLNKI